MDAGLMVAAKAGKTSGILQSSRTLRDSGCTIWLA